MRWIVCILVLALSACGTTPARFAYAPSSTPANDGPPSIASVTVTDTRADERDPHYVGAIRGGFGNPLKTLVSQDTIAEEVRRAFEQALSRRGLLGPGGRKTLTVQVGAFSANQYMGPDVHAGFGMQLRDPGGSVLYGDADDIREYEFKFFSNGIVAATDGLRDGMEQTMSHAIDALLNKPGFIAAARAP